MEIKGVNVFVREKNEFLAVKRGKEDEIFAGMWALPGGKIEEGETIKETAKREIFEETGLSLISIEDKFCMEGRLNIEGCPRLLIYIYRGAVSNETPSPHDKDIEKVEWIDRTNFVSSLKKNNYPKEEIEKLEAFFDAEGLR